MTHPEEPPTSDAKFVFAMEEISEEMLRVSERLAARVSGADVESPSIEELLVIRHMTRPRDDKGAVVLSPIHREIAERIAVEHGVDPTLVVAELLRNKERHVKKSET